MRRRSDSILWDILIASLLTVGFCIACNTEGIVYRGLKRVPLLDDLLTPLKTGIPTAFYATLATLSGLLMGFTFVAVPVGVCLISHKKLTAMKETDLGMQIHRLYFRTIIALGLATLTAILGVFTGNAPPLWVAALNFGIFLFAGCRVVHCLNVMSILVKIIESPSAESRYAKMDEPG